MNLFVCNLFLNISLDYQLKHCERREGELEQFVTDSTETLHDMQLQVRLLQKEVGELLVSGTY